VIERGAAPALALLALACAAPAAAPTQEEPALVALDLLRGFSTMPAPSAAPRVIALVDATEAMSRRDSTGAAFLDGARAGAKRFLGDLPSATPVSLRVLGGERGAGCGSPPREIAGPGHAGDTAWSDALDRMSAAGDGSLADALSDLAEAEGPPRGSPLRIVAWSSLRSRCEASLCAAADALARRGARLDLVVLGDAPTPACLAKVELRRDAFTPAASRTAVGFRVERLAPEPAVIGCSDAGGLPIAVPRGPTRVVVALDPPLVLERSFPPDTRWVLEVVDFPTLGAGERQWRWLPMPRADRGGATP